MSETIRVNMSRSTAQETDDQKAGREVQIIGFLQIFGFGEGPAYVLFYLAIALGVTVSTIVAISEKDERFLMAYVCLIIGPFMLSFNIWIRGGVVRFILGLSALEPLPKAPYFEDSVVKGAKILIWIVPFFSLFSGAVKVVFCKFSGYSDMRMIVETVAWTYFTANSVTGIGMIYLGVLHRRACVKNYMELMDNDDPSPELLKKRPMNLLSPPPPSQPTGNEEVPPPNILLNKLEVFQNMNVIFRRFGDKISPYFVCQIILVAFSVCNSIILVTKGIYVEGPKAIADAEHYVCLAIVQLPLFWVMSTVLRGVNVFYKNLAEYVGAIYAKRGLCFEYNDDEGDEGYYTMMRFNHLVTYIQENIGGVAIFGRRVDTILDVILGMHLTFAVFAAGPLMSAYVGSPPAPAPAPAPASVTIPAPSICFSGY